MTRQASFPLWLREVGLGVALGAVILLGVLAWSARSNQHQQICALERYIEARFAIDRAVPNIPPSILAARLRAIRQMEDDAGANCNLKEASP